MRISAKTQMKEERFESIIEKLDAFIRNYYVNRLIKGSLYFLGISIALILFIDFVEHLFRFGWLYECRNDGRRLCGYRSNLGPAFDRRATAAKFLASSTYFPVAWTLESFWKEEGHMNKSSLAAPYRRLPNGRSDQLQEWLEIADDDRLNR